MKLLTLFTLSSCLVLLFACSKPAIPPETYHTTGTGPTDLPVSVTNGKCAKISFGSDELQLCAESINDGRCPTDVFCDFDWRGTALVEFSFIKNGVRHEFTLSLPITSNYQKELVISGYRIKLVDVRPYPSYRNPVPADKQKAEVIISNY